MDINNKNSYSENSYRNSEKSSNSNYTYSSSSFTNNGYKDSLCFKKLEVFRKYFQKNKEFFDFDLSSMKHRNSKDK
jgi:hypothetical protein